MFFHHFFGLTPPFFLRLECMFHSDDDDDDDDWFTNLWWRYQTIKIYDQNVRAAKTTALMVGALLFCYTPLIGEWKWTWDVYPSKVYHPTIHLAPAGLVMMMRMTMMPIKYSFLSEMAHVRHWQLCFLIAPPSRFQNFHFWLVHYCMILVYYCKIIVHYCIWYLSTTVYDTCVLLYDTCLLLYNTCVQLYNIIFCSYYTCYLYVLCIAPKIRFQNWPNFHWESKTTCSAMIINGKSRGIRAQLTVDKKITTNKIDQQQINKK